MGSGQRDAAAERVPLPLYNYGGGDETPRGTVAETPYLLRRAWRNPP